MNKTTIVVVIIILVIIFGAWWMFSNQEEVDEPAENTDKPAENGSDGTTENKNQGEAEADEDNPYIEAETVEPMDDGNVAMHEDFSGVLKEVFEKEPKLVKTGGINRVSYVTPRVITADDVKEIKNLLAEKGYETRNSKAEGDLYELDLTVSEDILEEKYDGDVGGNLYFKMWTAEEGDEAQKIKILTL